MEGLEVACPWAPNVPSLNRGGQGFHGVRTGKSSLEGALGVVPG